MPTSGWRSCGAGIYIPREPDPGLRFLFGRFTRATVLRLLTTEQITGVDTESLAEAWSLWDRIWADDELFSCPSRRIPRRSPARALEGQVALQKVWAELAFTAVAGLKLITFDRALKSRGNGVLVLSDS